MANMTPDLPAAWGAGTGRAGLYERTGTPPLIAMLFVTTTTIRPAYGQLWPRN